MTKPITWWPGHEREEEEELGCQYSFKGIRPNLLKVPLPLSSVTGWGPSFQYKGLWGGMYLTLSIHSSRNYYLNL